jgi:adenylate kinase family enzyme
MSLAFFFGRNPFQLALGCWKVSIPSQVLVFEADDEVMMQRMLERGKTSGREDDNVETFKKRFRTWYRH